MRFRVRFRGISGGASGGAERKRDVSGWCSADCAPPGGDDWSCMARPPCLSGVRGKFPSPRDCHHTIAAKPMRSIVVVRSVVRKRFGSQFSQFGFLLTAQACCGPGACCSVRRAFFGGGLPGPSALGYRSESQARAGKTDGKMRPGRDRHNYRDFMCKAKSKLATSLLESSLLFMASSVGALGE